MEQDPKQKETNTQKHTAKGHAGILPAIVPILAVHGAGAVPGRTTSRARAHYEPCHGALQAVPGRIASALSMRAAKY